MNYDIIFYHSGRTAELERTLAMSLEGIGLVQTGAAASADPAELSGELSGLLNKRRLIFIIGGMDGGIQSTDKVLSGILSDNEGKKPDVRPVGKDGRIMCSGEQTIVLLPDSGEDIKKLMPELKEKLRSKYDLYEEDSELPEIDSVADALDKELSDERKDRVPGTGMTAEKRSRMQLEAIKGAIAILLVIAAAQLAAASYIFLNM